ncbi:MAG: NPCBM/NEW2 domain-containing protein [Planctomycetota bacterium]
MRDALQWTLCWLSLSVIVSAAEVVTVVDVSGRTTEAAALTEWTTDRIVVGESQATSLDDLLTLNFNRPSVPLASGDSLVILANGDRLVVRPVGVFDDELTATWQRIPLRAALKLPLEIIAAIIFELPTAADDRRRLFADLQTLPSGQDIALLANGDRVQGEFERLDGAFVQLKSPTGLLKLNRTRVQAIRLNPELTSAPRIEGRRLSLSLRDGSRLTVRNVMLTDQGLKCETFSKQEFLLPVSECVSCRVYGVKAIPLADRDESQFTFVSYLSHKWPLVRNANVLRGPLTLRGVESGTGLGMHSRSAVTFELQPDDREFRATIGIDDCAAGNGSVRFAVELDGKRIWESPELTGKSAPVVVPPVKLEGHKKLTLVVEFGALGDVSDYADWCDAIIVRK